MNDNNAETIAIQLISLNKVLENVLEELKKLNKKNPA